MPQHLSQQDIAASTVASPATWLETAAQEDQWNVTGVEQEDIWLGTVGTRETDRGCPNTQSRGHPRQPVSAHTTTYAHIPTLTRTTCTNRVAHTHGKLGNHTTLMLLDSGASCSVASKSCVPDKHIEPIQSTRLVNADAHTHGKLGNHTTLMLLDSGASCSVASKSCVPDKHIEPIQSTRLVNADGRNITPCGVATMTVGLGQFSTSHKFVVVNHLSTPVILGCDFLFNHGYVLDFDRCTFHRTEVPDASLPCNMITLDDECPQAIPTTRKHTNLPTVDMPADVHPALMSVLQEYKSLFSTELGKTTITEHTMKTGEALPIKVPPRPIPFHYADRVHQQLQEMTQEGIIRPSTSPWCAPAVYVPKPSGEIRICVDYVQLNSVTKKDSYPVPRAEGPQQKLAGSPSLIYWQFPMEPQSIEKTAFCPGPGYGLWEFTRMPYGLTGATQTCQRGLDSILHNCKDCIDNYVDDCIVFSDYMTAHISDLRRVLDQLRAAGFTLCGSKCFFGKTKI